MATNFPASLDTLTNPSATDTLDSPPHDEQHADANDAIEALQAKVGVDGSADTTSLDYKVSQLETDVSQLETDVGNLESRPVETKTASYTLVAGDVNKRIVMNNAGATTITVNDGVFAAGDTVWIHNIGAGTCTVTAGTATVNTAASLDLAQWEGGSLYFTSASSAIFFRGPAAGVGTANFTNTATGTYSSGGKNYKYITFTSSGTLTVDKDGLATILMISGGSKGGGPSGGGGGGGGGSLFETEDAYLPVGTLTVIVGAGNGNFSSLDLNKTWWTMIVGGGSGNGKPANTGSIGSGITGLGNPGGNGYQASYPNWQGGGGGGRGAAGGNAGSPAAGIGGAGLASSITGSPVTRAGGGGGGSSTSGKQRPGVDGGGNGAGGYLVVGGNATANTGGGGGGGGDIAQGGNGGSGLVVVRVEV